MEGQCWIELLFEEMTARDGLIRALLGEDLERFDPEPLDGVAELRTFRRDQIMLEQGEEPDHLLCLLTGGALVQHFPPEADGQERTGEVVNLLERLDVAGEVGLVGDIPRTARVTASARSKALFIHRRKLMMLAAEAPELALALVRWCARNAAFKIVRTRELDQLPYATGLRELSQGTDLVTAIPQQRFCDAWAERLYPPASADVRHKIRVRLLEMTCFGWGPKDITEQVAELFQIFVVDEGEAIIADGADEQSLLLLASGRGLILGYSDDDRRELKVVRGFSEHHEHPIHVVMGESGFLTGAKRGGTIIAEQRCEVLELSTAAAAELARTAPRLALRLHLELLLIAALKLHEVSVHRAIQQGIAHGKEFLWHREDGSQA